MSRGGALPGSFPRTLFADDLPPLQSPAGHVVDAIGKLDSQRSGHALKTPVSPLPAKLKSRKLIPLKNPSESAEPVASWAEATRSAAVKEGPLPSGASGGGFFSGIKVKT
jgi:hypothetical protein